MNVRMLKEVVVVAWRRILLASNVDNGVMPTSTVQCERHIVTQLVIAAVKPAISAINAQLGMHLTMYRRRLAILLMKICSRCR